MQHKRTINLSNHIASSSVVLDIDTPRQGCVNKERTLIKLIMQKRGKSIVDEWVHVQFN